jgi:hypothetical protein
MSRNMMILIGAGAVVLLGIGWFLTGGAAQMALSTQGVDVDRNLDGTVTYETEEGSVTTGAGATMPANWPSDVPQPYQGATIVYSGTTNPTTGAAGSAVVYTVNAPAPAVIEYYAKDLATAGWKVENTAAIQGMNMIAATKDNRTVGVYVTDSDAGAVQVTVGVEL